MLPHTWTTKMTSHFRNPSAPSWTLIHFDLQNPSAPLWFCFRDYVITWPRLVDYRGAQKNISSLFGCQRLHTGHNDGLRHSNPTGDTASLLPDKEPRRLITILAYLITIKIILSMLMAANQIWLYGFESNSRKKS